MKKDSQLGDSILIFPGGMPRSLAYLHQAIAEGRSIVGSSSLPHDPARSSYPAWTFLPFITSPCFDEALRFAIAKYNIGSIYTPNLVVWDYLNRCIAKSFPGVSLANISPLVAEVEPYKKASQFAASVISESLNLGAGGSAQPPLPLLSIAALFRHADVIPGMCDQDKIHALYEIFRFAPAGDIVEIGSWWGKSAFVLNYLSNCYDIGKLLCVDPWSNKNLVQNDDKRLVDQVNLNTEEAFDLFQINLIPYSNRRLNFLRLPSTSAASIYRSSSIIKTSTFGETHYHGKISILHIDGNHAYENVRDDIEAWSELVLPGGWIVLDDYVWPYGKGPEAAGNEYLARNHDRLETSFVMGSALFMQLKQ